MVRILIKIRKNKTMKKILTSILLLAFIVPAIAQEENNFKNVRFGLMAQPSLNWYKPDDPKKLEKAGSKLGFSWGIAMEFRLNSVAVIATGLQIDYDRGFINFLDTSTSYYYNTKDQVLLSFSDTAAAGKNNTQFYQLNDRIYRTNYLTLPFCLKMKTKDIGGMTYFMKFGLNSSLRLKAKVNDNITQLNPTPTVKTSQSDLDNTSDMKLFRFQLIVGGGAEYNLSGTTSIVFGLTFNYGFSNALTKESNYLLKSNGKGTNNYGGANAAFPQNAAASSFALTVGMLF